MDRSDIDNRDGRHARGFVGSILQRLGRHLEAGDGLSDRERDVIIHRLFHEGRRRGPHRQRFLLMMGLSAAIATLGVISNSTAVVIGAMLVAPLMGPVLSQAAAVVMGWPRRIVAQTRLVVLGAGVGVAVGMGIAFVVPWQTEPLPIELVARTSPNVLDLGIALAAGAAGAYAQVRRQASDALIGVAVAVALVPPLAVVGITLQLAEFRMALGAFLLFLANVSGIVMAAGLTFLFIGFVPGRRLLDGNMTIAFGLRWALMALFLIVLPMQFGRGSVLVAADPTTEVAVAVENYLSDETDDAELVGVSVDVEGDTTNIDVVVASSDDGPTVETLAGMLAERLGTTVQVSLQVVEAQVNRATVSDP